MVGDIGGIVRTMQAGLLAEVGLVDLREFGRTCDGLLRGTEIHDQRGGHADNRGGRGKGGVDTAAARPQAQS